jgi:hypothetical protein
VVIRNRNPIIANRTLTRQLAWLSTRKGVADEVAALLAGVVQNKAGQRASEGYRNWQVRPDSVRHLSIGGHRR